MGMTHYRFSIAWTRIVPEGNLSILQLIKTIYVNKTKLRVHLQALDQPIRQELITTMP